MERTASLQQISCTNVPIQWLVQQPTERIVALPLKSETVIAIVSKMRTIHTRHAYKTFGSLNKEGLICNFELFAKHKWIPHPEWKLELDSISLTFQDNLDLIATFALSLFVKRSRGLYKVFVIAQTHQIATWTDVRPSISVLRPRLGACDPSPLLHNNGTCLTCGHAPATSRCAGCRKVFYCNATCQKKNWKIHKIHCKAHASTRSE